MTSLGLKKGISLLRPTSSGLIVSKEDKTINQTMRKKEKEEIYILDCKNW